MNGHDIDTERPAEADDVSTDDTSIPEAGDSEVDGSAPRNSETPSATGSEQLSAVTVRPLAQNDFFAWYDLYAQYATFYEEELTDERAMRAWLWLHDENHLITGLVAVDASGALVGLAHVRAFERLLAGGNGLYIDDLFVSPAARKQGVARALIAAVEQQAKDGGYQIVRWITAKDNDTARRVYDAVAKKTNWVTYDLAVS